MIGIVGEKTGLFGGGGGRGKKEREIRKAQIREQLK